MQCLNLKGEMAKEVSKSKILLMFCRFTEIVHRTKLTAIQHFPLMKQ